MKVPSLSIAAHEMRMLREETEIDAQGLVDAVRAAREHKNTTIARGHDSVAQLRSDVTEFGRQVDELADAVDGRNGPPQRGASGGSTSNSGDSSPSGEEELEQPVAEAAEPEQPPVSKEMVRLSPGPDGPTGSSV